MIQKNEEYAFNRNFESAVPCTPAWTEEQHKLLNKNRRGQMKKEKGITLIALVITIIVLLILAGVTIAMVLGQDGIFKKAEEAKRLTTISQEKEIISLGMANIKVANLETMILENEQVKASQLQTEIEAKAYTVQVTGSNADGTGTLTVHYLESGNSYTVTQTGEITGPGNGGEEEPDNPGPTPEEGTIAKVAKPGDYISYTPNRTTFGIQSYQTGYSSTQTYTTTDYTGGWQVLYNDSEHGLQIISSKSVVDSFYQRGKVGYNQAISALNSLCRYYSFSNYTVEGSGRCVGSDPIQPTKETSQTESYLGQDTGCKIADNNYNADYTAMKDAKSQDSQGIVKTGQNYKLASREIYTTDIVGSDTEQKLFNIRYISLIGPLGKADIYALYSSGREPYESENSFGVRAVVTIKQGIKVASGTGTEADPYQMSIE